MDRNNVLSLIRILRLVIASAVSLQSTLAFVHPKHPNNRCRSLLIVPTASLDWISLTEDKAVQKRVREKGTGAQAQVGQKVEIDYVGTLRAIDWDVPGVIDCWLSTLQGLEGLADGFEEHEITANKLMDPDFFTEEFVTEKLGLSNRIQVKKLVMAAKRLSKMVTEFPSGTEFDSNKNGPYSFELGKKKAIRAMELVVASMEEGEQAEMTCRCDYAYGKEGIRRANGDVMVPEYATLCFNIKLLKCA